MCWVPRNQRSLGKARNYLAGKLISLLPEASQQELFIAPIALTFAAIASASLPPLPSS